MANVIIISADGKFIEYFKNLDCFSYPSIHSVTNSASNLAALNSLITPSAEYFVFFDKIEVFRFYANEIHDLLAFHKNIKFVMITSCKNFNIAMEAIRMGVYDYMVKPIGSIDVEKILERETGSAPKVVPFISRNEYSYILNHLMTHDSEFVSHINQIFLCGELNRNMKLYDIQQEFFMLYSNLLNDLKKQYPYAENYINSSNRNQIISLVVSSTEELKPVINDIFEDLFETSKIFDLNTSSDLINRINNYALENVEKDISLEKIAGIFFVNKSYLSHLFKQETGITFVKHFTKIRMLRSRVLLAQHMKVYECALALGYEDTEYFSKTFKKYFGVRPTEYNV